MDIQKIMNGPVMWVACGIPIVLVIIQAVVFARASRQAGKQIGLSDEQFLKAIKGSAITAIGPSIVILSSMLSLLVSMGGPIAWMRLSLIGAVMFESMAAGFGTSSVGVSLGTDAMTGEAFTMAVWTMILGSIAWTIFATFAANRMDAVEKKISKGDSTILMVISSAAIIGAFSALSASHLARVDKNSLACVLGAVIMAVLIQIGNKKQIRWLQDWALTLSILGSVVVTALI